MTSGFVLSLCCSCGPLTLPVLRRTVGGEGPLEVDERVVVIEANDGGRRSRNLHPVEEWRQSPAPSAVLKMSTALTISAPSGGIGASSAPIRQSIEVQSIAPGAPASPPCSAPTPASGVAPASTPVGMWGDISSAR